MKPVKYLGNLTVPDTYDFQRERWIWQWVKIAHKLCHIPELMLKINADFRMVSVEIGLLHSSPFVLPYFGPFAADNTRFWEETRVEWRSRESIDIPTSGRQTDLRSYNIGKLVPKLVSWEVPFEHTFDVLETANSSSRDCLPTKNGSAVQTCRRGS